jgi:hypothetical protein
MDLEAHGHRLGGARVIRERLGVAADADDATAFAAIRAAKDAF